MKKERFISSALIVLLLILSLFLSSCNACEVLLDDDYKERYTEDIKDYNTEEYPNKIALFPDKIPENAEIVKYSYFDHFYEVCDIYLELKFDSIAEMQAYINDLVDIAEEKLSAARGRCLKNGELFLKQTNLGNSLYEDLICVHYHTADTISDKIGYKVSRKDESVSDVYIVLAAISYSESELTVVQTYSTGSFEPTVHKKCPIPAYVKRFNLPLDRTYESWIRVELE